MICSGCDPQKTKHLKYTNYFAIDISHFHFYFVIKYALNEWMNYRINELQHEHKWMKTQINLN